MSNFTWFTYEVCPECGNEKETRVPLIEALENAKVAFGDDVRVPIEEIRKELKLALNDYQRLCALRPEKREAYSRGYQYCKDSLESRAGKILKLR